MKWTYIFVTLVAIAFALPSNPTKRHERYSHQAGRPANKIDSDRHNIEGAKGGRNNQRPAKLAQSIAPEPNQRVTQQTNKHSEGEKGQTAAPAQNTNTGGINPALVPDFGQGSGLRPDGAGNCQTDLGKAIPCKCPPSRAAFLSKLEQFVSAGSFPGGLPAPFPSGISNGDAIVRFNTLISTLQNFDGKPGVGCPAIAAPNFTAQRAKLQAA